MFRRQIVNSLNQFGSQFLVVSVSERVSSHLVAFFHYTIHRFPKIQRIPVLASLGVDSVVDRDAVKPRVKGRLSLKALDLAIGSKKGFLRDLQGVFSITKQAHNHHEHLLLVPGNKLLEGAYVPGLAFLDQFPVAYFDHNEPILRRGLRAFIQLTEAFIGGILKSWRITIELSQFPEKFPRWYQGYYGIIHAGPMSKMQDDL